MRSDRRAKKGLGLSQTSLIRQAGGPGHFEERRERVREHEREGGGVPGAAWQRVARGALPRLLRRAAVLGAHAVEHARRAEVLQRLQWRPV